MHATRQPRLLPAQRHHTRAHLVPAAQGCAAPPPLLATQRGCHRCQQECCCCLHRRPRRHARARCCGGAAAAAAPPPAGCLPHHSCLPGCRQRARPQAPAQHCRHGRSGRSKSQTARLRWPARGQQARGMCVKGKPEGQAGARRGGHDERQQRSACGGLQHRPSYTCTTRPTPRLRTCPGRSAAPLTMSMQASAGFCCSGKMNPRPSKYGCMPVTGP